MIIKSYLMTFCGVRFLGPRAGQHMQNSMAYWNFLHVQWPWLKLYLKVITTKFLKINLNSITVLILSWANMIKSEEEEEHK